MKSMTTMAPFTISEQARLLDMPVSQLRRIYKGATNVPVTALEKTVRLQHIWAALEENSAAGTYLTPETRKTEIKKRLRDLLEDIGYKCLRFDYQVFRMEEQTRSLPGKMALVQQLETEGAEGFINKEELGRIKEELEEKIKRAGCYRLEAIRVEKTLLETMEQTIQDLLKKL